MVSNLVWVTGSQGTWNTGRWDVDVGCAAGHGKGCLEGIFTQGDVQRAT